MTVFGFLPGTMYRLLVEYFDGKLFFYSLPGKTSKLLMVLDTLRMFDDLYSSPISFMLTAVFVLRMQQHVLGFPLMWHFSLYSLVLTFDDSVIFLLPFTQRGAMAISIPMVPYASNKGNREKKKNQPFQATLTLNHKLLWIASPLPLL